MDPDSFAAAGADLERLVDRRSRDAHCSIAWGVVAGGELVLTGGTAAAPDGVPTEHTVFRIASMTKSFTAAAVLILRDRRLLRLDDVVAVVAPELGAVAPPTRDSPSLTIRDLLSMAGGMATDDVWADRHLDIADDHFDELLRGGLTFAWPPRTTVEYSNIGFAMLGRIIRHVSGVSAQEFITEHLLHPLAMDRTTWRRPDHDDWARPFEVRDGERVADDEPLGDGVIAPMGGLWSCVADVARWVAWLADAFPARDAPDDGPLCRASRREMQQVQRAGPTTHSPPADEHGDAVPERIDGGGYGFGLFVRHDTRFRHFVYHSGGLPGYGSNMRWVPGSGVGVVALANVTYAPMSAMTRRMLELLDDHGAVPHASCVPSSALAHAAERLAVLLSDWTAEAAAELFADNVEMDEPLERRAAQAAAMVADHGVLTVVSIDAETPMRGRVAMRHADGTPRCVDIEMSPLVPPRVQFYETVAG